MLQPRLRQNRAKPRSTIRCVSRHHCRLNWLSPSQSGSNNERVAFIVIQARAEAASSARNTLQYIFVLAAQQMVL